MSRLLSLIRSPRLLALFAALLLAGSSRAVLPAHAMLQMHQAAAHQAAMRQAAVHQAMMHQAMMQRQAMMHQAMMHRAMPAAVHPAIRGTGFRPGVTAVRPSMGLTRPMDATFRAAPWQAGAPAVRSPIAARVPVPAGRAAARPHPVVRSFPPAAARSSFFVNTPASSLNLFPRPFGIASNNAQVSGLVAANIPPAFMLSQGFGNPFFLNSFGNPFFLNSQFVNPAFLQTGFNSTLGSFPFNTGSSFFFNPSFGLMARHPNLTAGLASGNPFATANALGVLARHPGLFNAFANRNPFLVASALGTLSATPNAFTGLVGTNPLIANAFAGVSANPNLLGTFAAANPFVFANAAFNPTLFNTLTNANPALGAAVANQFFSPSVGAFNNLGAFGAFNGGLSPLAAGFGGLGYNPFLASLYSGYGLGGYGMGGYGLGGLLGSSGSNGPSASAQAQNYINDALAAQKPREANNVLTAYGIPNEEGRLQWPTGLRVLGPSATTDPLRQRIDSLVGTMLEQKLQYGRVDATLLDETNHLIDSLRHQLADHSTDLSFTSYQDSRTFLARLQDALKKMG